MKKYYFVLPKGAGNLARVISENKMDYILGFADGHVQDISKKQGQESFYVGDVVEIVKQEKLSLHERKKVIRKSSNTTAKSYHFSEEDQVLATNIDQLFILIPLDQNFSISKLERYVLVFSQQDVELTVILSKKDLCPNPDAIIKEVTTLYPAVSVIALSIHDPESTTILKSQLKVGGIGLFIGTSGAGKSTLVNHLQEDYTAKVNEVKRSDGKGKHTTTSSTFIYCPDLDYYVVDTPGFKGFDSHYEMDTKSLFSVIDDLARSCKFSNCQHKTEAKCAVKEAIEKGKLNPKLLERYHYNLDKLELLSKRRKSWRL